MKILIAVVIALFATSALAETLTWTAPDTREDGKPLAPEEIESYLLNCGGPEITIPALTADGSYEIIRSDVLPGYGEHECTLSAVDTDGLTSKPSNTAAINWPAAPPSAPTMLIIIKD